MKRLALVECFLVWTLASLAEFSLCHHSNRKSQIYLSISPPLAATYANLAVYYSKYGLTGLSKTAQANLSANIVSTLQAGCFFGALLASPAADRWGRRYALLGAATLGVLGVVMQAAASGHLEVMYIGR